ncbi:MAG: family 16 glycosylhydrolase [Gloeobacteraceae cyanobacterium ES-bin-144]|nr:family 16 glycosylhydrolase [Verrucomicrobiales bacterium]
MKINSIIRPSSLLCLILISLSVVPHLGAQGMTADDVTKLRDAAKVAEDALARVLRNAESPELRKDAEAARTALGQVTGSLDKHIAKLPKSGNPEDIYDNGNQYPPPANVSISNIDVPVGATVVHVPVTLDRKSPNTVIAFVRVFDGKGGRANPDATKPVIFRPGDPLTKTVSFNVSGMTEGNNLKAAQSMVPDGAKRTGGEILITAKAGAVNAGIEDGGQKALKFSPHGELRYSASGASIQFDDKGGPNRFSSALSHGRTQVGNGETGYYGTVDLGGFTRAGDDLILSSRRLEKPVAVGSPATMYPFLATMLSGHKTPETQFKYGSVEWIVKMSNRKGSWPALWLLPTSGWPPEIDVYEGFGYNGSWKFPSDLSTNLHGGHNSNHKFSRSAMNMKMRTFGLPDTLDSEFHTFAVTVSPEWITMFINGGETMRYANPFKGETWYPLTNVAVKADPKSPYDDGSGDMVLRSLKVWRAE